MKRLSGSVAVVTHAASGLGAGIAARLRDEGATVLEVATAWRSKAEAEQAIAEVLRQHGRVDVLVNGVSEQAAFAPLETKADAVDAGPQQLLWAMQAVYTPMRAQGGGRIVNLVALFGDSLNRQLADAVAGSEAGKSLTRSAAEEWGQYGILVNAIAPAADSDGYRRLRDKDPAAADALVAATPMQRMGDPVADIGGAVMLLLSDAGRFLTGHVLYADGGQHLTPTPFEALVPMH